MNEMVVDVERREAAGKNVARRLRRAGRIPAVLYGTGKDPVSLTVDPRRLVDVLRSHAGQNTIFQLNLAGTDQRRHVMIREYQVDPVGGQLIHADFVRIEMDTAIEVEVPVVLKGEAAGVKLDGGILEIVIRQVRISCLPSNIPDGLPVDISEMKIGDHRSVSDLVKSDKVTILSDPNGILVVCQPPAKEEPAPGTVVEAVAAPAEPEVIKKGKQVDEEAAAEGGDKKEKKQPEGKK
ncbi:MAG TPA: 50S ribosomal protein L25 [Candidatus Polarisedimenticolia bacterium]|nr:50S ribosomal protein L25 [Candidatus Polarisedimenticolia bacterium]